MSNVLHFAKRRGPRPGVLAASSRAGAACAAPVTPETAASGHAAYAAMHPVACALALEGMPAEEVAAALAGLSPENRAETFVHLAPAVQVEVAGGMTRRDLAALVTEMAPDDRVDLLRHMPEERRDNVLPALAQAERDDIRRLSSYPEGTAGSVMTSEYASLSADMTAEQAIGKLRQEAPDKETIYYAYVVDAGRRLLGQVSLKDLILARPEARVADIMQREVVSASVMDDREAAVRKIAQYDLLALPITNGGDALVGIITHDDALDVLHQEYTEDLEKLMAIGGSHEAGVYLSTSSWTHFRNRASWIVGLAALGLVSGLIIHRFEDTLMNLLILALYMPMVADTGGNTGSQSATVVVRALALGEIGARDTLRILFKELKVSLLLAGVLGVLSLGKVLFLSQGDVLPAGMSLLGVGTTIAVALGLQVVTSTLVGAVLPLAAVRCKLDPAVVASPALTTVVDITGLLIYFGTAKLLLGI